MRQHHSISMSAPTIFVTISLHDRLPTQDIIFLVGTGHFHLIGHLIGQLIGHLIIIN